jgi:hypothetical protein
MANNSKKEIKKSAKPTQADDWQDVAVAGDDWQDVGVSQKMPMTDDELNMAIEQGSAQSLFKHGAPIAAGLLAQAVAPGGPIVVGGLSGLVQGGVQGAMLPADSTEKMVSNITKEGLKGGAVGAGLGGVGSFLGGVGDRAMQMAVGLKKHFPGVGTTLAKEGIFGTKDAMKAQIKAAKASIGSEMQALAAARGGKANVGEVASAVRKLSAPKVIKGRVSSLDAADVDKINAYADEIASSSSETLEDLLKRRMAAYDRANFTDEAVAGSALKSRLSEAEGLGASSVLKEQIPEIIPLDKRYSALSKASEKIVKPESLQTSLVSPRLAMGALGAGTGYVAGGPLGALTGYGLTTPLGLSTIGQATSKAAPVFGSPASRALLIEMIRAEEAKRK